MSRLTGSEFREMIEAYNAVYAPQITEQQIQEDFENWVYSLVDEGEDLSEYTWDEMYGAYNYINEQVAGEMGGTGLGGAALAGMGGLAGGIGYYGAKAINAAQTLMSRGKSKSKQQGGGFANAQGPSASDRRVAQGQASATAANNPQPKSKTVPRQEISGTPPTGQKPRVTVNNTETSTSSGAGAGGGNQPPKTPEPPKPAPKPPEPPKQPSGGSNKPPGFGEKLKQRMADDAAKRAAEREARRARPNAIGQAVQDKAVDLTARGLNKLATGVKRAAVGSGIAGAAGVADQELLGGVVGKSARDFTNWTKQAGSEYDKSMGRGEKPAAAPATPAPATPAPTKPKYKYENYSVDFDNNQYINEKKVLAKRGNTWVSVETDPSGNKKETELKINEINPEAIKRYNSLATQKAKQQAPTTTSEPKRGSLNSQGKFYVDKNYGYQSWGSAKKLFGPASEIVGDKPPEPAKPAPTAPGKPPVAPTAPGKPPVAPKSAIERSAQGYAVGTTKGGTKYEIRTPTRAEMDASRKAGGGEAGVKAAVAAGQPTTGPAPTQAQMSDAGAAAKAAAAASKVKKESYDAYDLVLEYLLSQGHAETVAEAQYLMTEMDAEMIGDIVEDGFNSSGRYDVGGGRTVGPVAGAIRSLVTGNLPKQRTYIPPSPRQGTNKPPATPTSKGDSGKLTDFGAGGGRAKLNQGMTVGQVERQGRMNKGDYSG